MRLVQPISRTLPDLACHNIGVLVGHVKNFLYRYFSKQHISFNLFSTEGRAEMLLMNLFIIIIIIIIIIRIRMDQTGPRKKLTDPIAI